MDACTIVARNYIAFARVLAQSYAQHHPDRRLTVLLVDGEPRAADAEEPFETVYPSDLGLTPDTFHRMAAMYDPTELSTGMKPWLLRFLLARDRRPVLFLDPDVEVHGSLAELDEVATQHGIVLTPHSLGPVPRDGERPTELDILRSGVFNLGFLAVGPQATGFLEWWGERLTLDSLLAPEEELFVDQRLVDLVPAYFDHLVLRDPGYNVAYWNLFERDVVWEDGGYAVNGQPLRFFHFSGFDPERPSVLSKYHTRAPEGARPAIRRLCEQYADRLMSTGHREQLRTPYRFAQARCEIPFDRRLRRLYREAMRAARDGAAPTPPDPFESVDSEAFIAWVRAGGKLGGMSAGRRAASHVAAGPDPHFPVRSIRFARSIVLRLLRHYDEHQRKIHISLLDALSDADRTAETALSLTAALTKRLERIEETIEQAAEHPSGHR